MQGKYSLRFFSWGMTEVKSLLNKFGVIQLIAIPLW